MHVSTKIPTLFGLMLFIVLVGGFIVGFEQLSRIPSLASADTTPKNVEVTNVSDTSFTISWITDSPTTGAVIVAGLQQKPDVAFDERDLSADKTGKTGNLGRYLTHSVTYRLAQPGTTYTIRLLSNGKTFSGGDLSQSVRTGVTLIGSANDRGPAYGSVVTTTSQSASGALIYLTLEGSQKLSTLVSSGGTWLIPLNLIRTADLRQYLPTQDRIVEQIMVRSATEQSSAVTDTLNDSPVPEMRLGKNYDFRKQQALGSPDQSISAGETTTNGPIAMNPNVLGETTSRSGRVTLMKPAEGAVLSSFWPLIQGTGVPGNRVTVILGITQPFGGVTTVETDGVWRYTTTRPLDPGKQSVTITSADGTGKPVAITHMFEILKSGTQVLGIATPSASLTPTLAATSSPTPTSTLSGQTIPQTGSLLPTIFLLIMSFGLIMGGAAAFVL